MEQHLSQYRVFYTVAKTGNISHAAKELFISQPAISKAVSKLEESLGVTLFRRSSRGVTLTPEGRVLYDHVSTAFSALEQGESELRRIQNFNIGQIRFGCSDTLCRYVLLPYLKGFIAENPHIRILIQSQDTAKNISLLEQQQIDIGLVSEPKNRKSISFYPVMQISDTFVCTQSYLDNLRIREGARVNIFEAGMILMLDRRNMTRIYVDSYLAENGIEPKNILEADNMDLLIEFAKTGLGIGCVDREFVRKELEDGSLIEIPMKPKIRPRTIGFALNPAGETRSILQFISYLQKRGTPILRESLSRQGQQ
ncbi:LysR family transcriptional regulator [Clostridium vitabionis]|uniref:LysR family transcriptional regulator n=1 Tax=Clostridium vitabionis TaxID=2784388 RepID=UPI00188C2DFB|nr:LysR family transcriptional regulator [Clostridium vitabionis]